MFRFVPRRAYRAARALALKGRFDDAEQVYRRILKAAPDDAVARHDLAVVLFAMGQTYPAYEMLKEALQRDSFRAPYFATMAEMLEHPQFRAHMNAPYSGPFNGQQLRQRVFVQLIETIRPRTIFETGTYHGATTDFMAQATKAHVFTCELEPNYFRFAAERFRGVPNITLVNLDSRSFLKRYVPLFARRDAACLCYLDAHWDEADLPLLDELRILFEHAPRAVIMVDDFEVWDDAGYSFDDYGPAGRLTLPYLAPLAPFAPRYFFPIGSENETGMRRGSVVLTIDPDLAAGLERIPELRPAPPPIVARAANP